MSDEALSSLLSAGGGLFAELSSIVDSLSIELSTIVELFDWAVVAAAVVAAAVVAEAVVEATVGVDGGGGGDMDED